MDKVKMAVLGALAVCAGCATKEMKSTPFYTGSEVTYTGRVEDRVNLWPAAYYREPVGSILWPTLSFSNDHFAIRPIYSQYKQAGASGTFDEFNLFWPIAQADTKRGEYRVIPFFWGDGYFTLFPEFWVNRETIGLLPIVVDREFDWMAVLPLFWADFKGDDRYHTLFPLYWHSSAAASSRECFWAAAGLGGFMRRGGQTTRSWLLPLYYADDETFLSLPYSQVKDGDCDDTVLMCGLAGLSTRNGAYDASWCAPLYYHDRDTFVTPFYGRSSAVSWLLPFFWKDEETFLSPFYMQAWNTAGETTRWIVPPLLSGYTCNPATGEDRLALLFGLGGRETAADGSTATWAFPVFYWDDELFLMPLYGKTKNAEWVVPLYYRDGESFVTLLGGGTADSHWIFPLYWKDKDDFSSLAYCRNVTDRKTTHILPWLLSEYWTSRKTQASGAELLLGVGGYRNDETGARVEDWCFPLYGREKNSYFASIPFGYWGGGTSQTNTWWCTPLVGTRAGATSGGWIFPVLDIAGNPDYDKIASLTAAPTLPDWVGITTGVRTNIAKRVRNDTSVRAAKAVVDEAECQTNIVTYLTAPHFSSKQKLRFCLLGKHIRSASTGMSAADQCRARTTQESGSALVCDRQTTQSATFDLKTRRRVKEESSSKIRALAGFLFSWTAFESKSAAQPNRDEKFWETVLFTLLFNASGTTRGGKTVKGSVNVLGPLYDGEWTENESEQSVLWRVWHHEKKNGDVSVDMFPGFTYDAKKNGYHQTSFLWRLFRYENDPQKGTSLDLLFLPLKRP